MSGFDFVRRIRKVRPETPVLMITGYSSSEGQKEADELGVLRYFSKPLNTDAVLLAPEQAFFLRENLKLRLLGARVALLSRDAQSYQGDLRAALTALERHFDVSDRTVAATAATLRKLQAAQVQVDVPDLAETLEALRKLRPLRAKAPT
mgnify:CR=1 FL=1